jgi:2-desacetyl-2-hydroxyethyl bacteriochlorophyllide A dehydrogenase
MRSIQLVAQRTLEEHEMPQPPDPGHGEITVRIRAVGVCGSDLHWYQDGRVGEFPARYPQVLGHEPAGEVVSVGKGVEGYAAGDRVVIEPSLTCGHCEHCLKGHHNNCIHCVFMGGPQAPGMFREYVTLPAGNATHFPKEFDFATATLAEPLAVMMHMLELTDIHVGDTVAITGAGPIGMLCAAVARAAGAGRVFIADRLAYRLPMARAMGADVAIDTTTQPLIETVMDATRGRGVDIVLEAAGSAETVNAAIRMARIGGTVMLIGILSELYPKIDIHTAMAKELRLQTLKRSNHRAQEALDLMASGRIPTALITHRLPLEHTPKAFEMLTHYTDGVGKIIVELA